MYIMSGLIFVLMIYKLICESPSRSCDVVHFSAPRNWHRADWSRRARGEQCHPGPLRQSTGNGTGGASIWRCQN